MNHRLLAFDIIIVDTTEKAGIGECLGLMLLGALASLSRRVCQTSWTAIIVRVSQLIINMRVLIGCCGTLKHRCLFRVLFILNMLFFLKVNMTRGELNKVLNALPVLNLVSLNKAALLIRSTNMFEFGTSCLGRQFTSCYDSSTNITFSRLNPLLLSLWALYKLSYCSVW